MGCYRLGVEEKGGRFETRLLLVGTLGGCVAVGWEGKTLADVCMRGYDERGKREGRRQLGGLRRGREGGRNAADCGRGGKGVLLGSRKCRTTKEEEEERDIKEELIGGGHHHDHCSSMEEDATVVVRRGKCCNHLLEKKAATICWRGRRCCNYGSWVCWLGGRGVEDCLIWFNRTSSKIIELNTDLL